jgi:hypothetical protein
MDHFEVRSWDAIHRHFYISQLSQLFCARVHQALREKNDRWFVPDCGTGSCGGLRVVNRSGIALFGSHEPLSASGRIDCLLSTSQPTGAKIPSQKNTSPSAKIGHKSQSVELLYTT